MEAIVPFDETESVQVFIENEAESSIKNTYDEKTLAFIKSDTVSSPYPFPYGFVVGTLSGDGDCVDCFVVTDQGLKSGSLVECKPIHLLEQVEDGEVDHKVLAVPADKSGEIGDPEVEAIRGFIRTVFAHVPGKTMELGALHAADKAREYIRRCTT
ncbi:MAG: inorganic diphosphatase [Methyloligellaceae bacterium]